MIKILKPGNVFKVTCGACGAILQYETSDVKNAQTGPNEYESYITCPCCEEKLSLRKIL